MRIRRRRICFIQIADELVPDLSALFSGDLRLESEPSAELLCPISGERLRVTPRELALLAQMVAGEWVDAESFLAQTHVDPEDLRDLLQRHVVLSDHKEDVLSRQIIEKEEHFEQVGWLDLTAMYHAMTRWQNVANDESQVEHTPEAHRDRLNEWVEERGALVTHFPQREDAIARHAMELPAFDSCLAEILKARRTTRAFIAEEVLPQKELSYVLYGCFGAQGIRDLAPGVTAVKRTSASGGGLTPIDPYPIILRVEGLRSGIYHYDMGRHALELLVEKTEQELRDFMLEMTAGQDYFTQMQAAVVHVARFNRHHWKYRQHVKAYKALLMDSAHLSQTFYLLATERKLGAFYTAAINDADLGACLGLDPIEAAPIGISGLGVKASEENHALHFNPEPFAPK
ncbi:putative peptide maturation dehydrogenase [Oleiagrimonas sp. MCCC 1A03011]|uniref:putative peptide maturation dehydrogenase n=1 Tax=Oleiagrimonas sp. MCCC 1A03011 TaxID=1926883 RepID=UPI000DC4F80D|nr:putative peptide maturation dehydrogenase [Oleiagrimonas sp. MCCC 1A03011]RAP57175.1 putative peptide maturation dehydrogenase [Oleiagrimonas sp. MCCC 1A03011]